MCPLGQGAESPLEVFEGQNLSPADHGSDEDERTNDEGPSSLIADFRHAVILENHCRDVSTRDRRALTTSLVMTFMYFCNRSSLICALVVAIVLAI